MGADTAGRHGQDQEWTAAPSAAEQARSIAATAWSCTVTADTGRDVLHGAHTVTADGRVVLAPSAGSALRTAALCAPRGEPAAVVEFADVSPVPVRHRVRARLHLAGLLEPLGDGLVLRPTRILLHRARGLVLVDLDDWADAAPDPLAGAEARLLTHLADRHADAVERLTRLVDRRSLQGAVRVRPVALDRHGLTLRIERARAHGDARLVFHRPADDVTQLAERMHVLLAQAASACPRALRRQRADGDG